MTILLVGAACLLLFLRVTIYNSNSERDRKGLLIVAGIIFVAILGCRNGQINYGTDLNSYYRAYQRAALANDIPDLISTNVYQELGYPIMCFVFSRVIRWAQFIIYFQAAFCCGVTLRYIYKHSDDVFMSVMVFMSMGLLQFYLTGFRQAFAISICLLALESSEKKHYIRTILFTLLAISFHQTAILFVPILLLVRMKITKYSFLLDSVVFALLYRLGPWLVEMGNSMFDKNYEYHAYGNALGGLVNIIIEAFVIIAMIISIGGVEQGRGIKYTWNKEIEIYDSNKETNTQISYHYFHVLFIGMVLYALRYQTTTIERVSFYYTTTLMILLPQVIDKCFSPRIKISLRMFFVFGMLFLIGWRASSLDYIPFWDT